MCGPLTSTSLSVQREGEQLPTFEQLAQRVQANMKLTVRDVWGLMLTALPGRLQYLSLSFPHISTGYGLCVAARNDIIPKIAAALQNCTLDPEKCRGGISAALCAAGVGADLAEAILRTYPTPLSLRTAYEAAMKGAAPGQAISAAQRLLEGICVSPARKIGAQQSAKVFDSLFAAGWHCV